MEAGILLQEQVNPRLGLQISLCRAACREGVEGNEEMADPAVRTKKGRVKPSKIIKRDKYVVTIRITFFAQFKQK